MAPPTPQAARPLLTVGWDMPKFLAAVTLSGHSGLCMLSPWWYGRGCSVWFLISVSLEINGCRMSHCLLPLLFSWMPICFTTVISNSSWASPCEILCRHFWGKMPYYCLNKFLWFLAESKLGVIFWIKSMVYILFSSDYSAVCRTSHFVKCPSFFFFFLPPLAGVKPASEKMLLRILYIC